MTETVILVDRQDQQIGTAEKMAAHRQGSLHRAFSIFILNSQDQLLLQRRAVHKYHSGGLWTNTCCSHPRPGETTLAAAKRRLQEEMGFSCDLSEIFSFVYQAQLDRGLIEYEFDHVLLGRFNGKPRLNPEEADAYAWVDMDELQADIQNQPDRYTYWLKDCIDRFATYLTTLNVQV
jgi:isopentenyl-diphosphate delta-isomerase